jgi:hypothetical protein
MSPTRRHEFRGAHDRRQLPDDRRIDRRGEGGVDDEPFAGGVEDLQSVDLSRALQIFIPPPLLVQSVKEPGHLARSEGPVTST